MAVKGLRSSFKQAIVALVFHLCLYLSPNINKFRKRTTPNISISITGINKPRYEPLCSGCLKVENEIHFLFECNSYSTMRDDFTNSISSIVPNYLKLNNDQKLIYLMTCEDKNILRLTSLFVFNCFKRREISQLSSGGST